MNRFTQLFIIFFIALYPFWSWFFSLFTDASIDIISMVIILPLACYHIINPKLKIPLYLVFLILFTIYHISSIIVNDTFPSGANKLYYLLADNNVRACLLFFIIENSVFDKKFIKSLNRTLLVVVVITLIVSLIQIKFPAFFVSDQIAFDPDNRYFTENRIYSIFSWAGLNAIGITFPLIVAILLSFYANNRNKLVLLVISTVVVSFLTKARYVMISALIVLSQLIFVSTMSLKKKINIVVIFVFSLLMFYGISRAFNYNIQQVIDDRILEKSGNLGSFNSRILSYYVFLTVFPEHPLLGVGPETQDNVVRLLAGHAPIIHIGFLSYLYYYGILGCLFFFMFLFLFLRYSWQIGSKRNFWGPFYGLLGFCVANVTMVYFNVSEMGIILAVVYLRFFSMNKITLNRPVNSNKDKNKTIQASQVITA